MEMKLLNIGCGLLYHPKWTNLDFVSQAPNVIAHDIRKELPFSNNTFDVCYSSHLIEHLIPNEAEIFVTECFRVLKPSGIMRVVVPDLEEIVREYIRVLQRAGENITNAEEDYDWMMIELYDQVVRQKGGGMMAPYLRNPGCKNKEFIFKRIGSQAETFWSNMPPEKRSLLTKIRSKKPSWFINKIRVFAAQFFVTLFLGKEGQGFLDEGLFRQSGEVHKWMYDRFSLGRLLGNAGFTDIQIFRADESRIKDFAKYNLDTIDGNIRKPNSLFMEGLKPVDLQ